MSSPKVEKKLVPVVIYTSTHKIEGLYHAYDNGGRLLDDLNEQGRDFVPLTEVRMSKLSSPDGERIVTKFLAVNRLSITLFFPNPRVAATESGPGTLPPHETSGAGAHLMQSPFVPDLVISTKDE
ncbi:MAG TPA: hypothetical protein VFL28_15750 [bacterium]|nr:hypothetical protein [bacterium]